MAPWRKVLCAVDLDSDAVSGPLDEAAQTVLRAADREARLHGAELAVVHALRIGPGAPMSPAAVEQTILQREQISAAVMDALAAGVAQLTGRDPEEVAIHLEDGPPDKAIVEAAEELGADLVVVGSAGARGLRRLLLGSVAGSVVRHGHTSVLVARPAPESGPVLLAVDFSSATDRTIELAVEEARRRQARLAVVHAVEILNPELALAEPGVVLPATAVTVPPEELRVAAEHRLGELLGRLGTQADRVVTIGPPAEEIVRVARERRAELVVVGSSGRTGLDRLLLGSVSGAVVRDAPCPVLVARPPAVEQTRPVRAPQPSSGAAPL
jgi:nucleotide-binding universal stress UspA family protein